MATQNTGRHESLHPDMNLIGRLGIIERACLLVVVSITGAVIAGWLSPELAAFLPFGWNRMGPLVALGLLAGALALAMSRPGHRAWHLTVARMIGVAMAVLTPLIWFLSQSPDRGAWLLGVDIDLALPVPWSVQGTQYRTVLGLSLALLHARGKWARLFADLVTFLLFTLTLLVLAGYVFGASNLIGQSATVAISPHGLLCMLLLTYVRFMRRAAYGFFAVLLGPGIGSRVGRVALPLAIAMPFTANYLAHLLPAGLIDEHTASALEAVLTTLAMFGAGLLLARYITMLERELRDMSLTDELTQVYNLRGFNLLGVQAVREARRAHSTLTLVYVDLDGLKQINDRFGHEAGSQGIRDVAGLLRDHMRSSDIIARIGGDEFAVVFHGGPAEAALALQRMREAADEANRAGSRPYTLAYSVGQAVYDPAGQETFDELVARADTAMYAHKQEKKGMGDRR